MQISRNSNRPQGLRLRVAATQRPRLALEAADDATARLPSIVIAVVNPIALEALDPECCILKAVEMPTPAAHISDTTIYDVGCLPIHRIVAAVPREPDMTSNV